MPGATAHSDAAPGKPADKEPKKAGLMSQSGDAQKDGSAPVMFVFAGPNGSGKSSINAQVLKNPALGFLGEYINADDIAKSMESQIPDYQTHNIKAA